VGFLAVLTSQPFQAKGLDEGPLLKPIKLDAPVRELSIISTDEGFYPAHLTAYAGEKVRFFITGTSNDPQCFFIKEKGLFLGAKKGEVQDGEAFFEASGSFKFYCPSTKHSGRLTVLPHPRKENERKLASERDSNTRVWRPREE
jgi:hypothetical protein